MSQIEISYRSIPIDGEHPRSKHSTIAFVSQPRNQLTVNIVSVFHFCSENAWKISRLSVFPTRDINSEGRYNLWNLSIMEIRRGHFHNDLIPRDLISRLAEITAGSATRSPRQTPVFNNSMIHGGLEIGCSYG